MGSIWTADTDIDARYEWWTFDTKTRTEPRDGGWSNELDTGVWMVRSSRKCDEVTTVCALSSRWGFERPVLSLAALTVIDRMYICLRVF